MSDENNKLTNAEIESAIDQSHAICRNTPRKDPLYAKAAGHIAKLIELREFRAKENDGTCDIRSRVHNIAKGKAQYSESDPYVGVDAARNVHVHVNGVCYTNEDIPDRIAQLEACSPILTSADYQSET